MAFSNKSLVRLSEAMGSALGHARLDTLFFEHDIEAYNTGGNKPAKSLQLLRTIRERVANPDAAILEIAAQTPAFYWQDAPLLNALRLDGYEYADGRLIAAAPGAANLAVEMSQLEDQLVARGWTIAQTHYRQAADNYVEGRPEAANGMVRSFLEDFIPRVAEVRLNRAAGGPDASILALFRENILDEDEKQFLRGFWSGIQDRGPHAGLADHEEALFRLHVGTAIANYLLHKTRTP